jgi:hypothetical protein
MISFPDNTMVALKGLDEILSELFAENRTANDATVREIIKRLEAKKNFIPSSERAHREYAYVLLNEYKKYVKDRSESDRKPV